MSDKESIQKQCSTIVTSLLEQLRNGDDVFEIDPAFAEQVQNKHDIVQNQTTHDTKNTVISTSYEEKNKAILRLQMQISRCNACMLSTKRSNTVPGEGVMDHLVLIVGEAPGAEEDRTGSPFVGKAGKYLDTWLHAVHLSRKKNVFITNVVKCRPPNNRDPTEKECSTCSSFLHRQLAILQPKAILCLGRIASHFLSKRWGETMASLRTKHLYYNSIPMVTTYHPSAVLRNPDYRRPVWIDLQKLQKIVKDLVGDY